MPADKLTVVDLPSAAGGRSPGLAQAPAALRAAGLVEALRDTAVRVVSFSDLAPFPFRPDPEHPRCRNASAVTAAAGALAGEMERALAEGFALVLGGDCSIVAGAVTGARRFFQRPVGLIYLDADADLNTEETTPSGFVDGMALALALGRGPAEIVAALEPSPAIAPEHVALLGFRSLDDGEREHIRALALAMPVRELRTMDGPTAAGRALDAIGNDGGPVVVHLDVDLLDPHLMPVKASTSPGPGLSLEEAEDLLAALLASPRIVALEVVEFDPDRDADGGLALRLVDLLVRAWKGRLVGQEGGTRG